MLYSNLTLVMIRHQLTFDDIAQKLSIPTKTLLDKIFGYKDFTLREIEIIMSIFPNEKYEFLFGKTDTNSQT